MNGRNRVAASICAALFATGGLLATAPFATADAERVPHCNGEVATIVGEPGGGVIFGTTGQDVIVGTSGPDTIVADDGLDTVCGRGGRDEIFGNDQGDNLFGGGGNDVIWGGDDFGVDFISGEGGRRDRADAGPGVDTCTASTERQVQCELP
jgi:Ca2+-binding RTX toxin-like protein